MDDSQLKCTVIIPTYNRSRLLGHTLSSLTQQTLAPGEFEVIVADDGSSDDSRDVAESYRDRLRLSYYFQPDEGFRVAAARNIGIRHARAQVCVFLDSGMLAHSRFLAEHLASQASYAEPVAVVGYNYGHKQSDEGTWELVAEVDVSDPTAAIEKLAAQPKWHDIREPFYAKYTDEFHDLPAPWLIFWSANISARTAQVRAVGMFDENFRSWGAEDMDLGYRLHRDGARFVLNRRATAIHLPHSKDAEVNGNSSSRNYRYMAAKYGTPITGLLPSFPVINPYTMNDIIRERGLPSCAAYLAARHLPAQVPPAAAGRLPRRADEPASRRRAGQSLSRRPAQDHSPAARGGRPDGHRAGGTPAGTQHAAGRVRDRHERGTRPGAGRAVADGTGSPAWRALVAAFVVAAAIFVAQQILTPLTTSFGELVARRIDGLMFARTHVVRDARQRDRAAGGPDGARGICAPRPQSSNSTSQSPGQACAAMPGAPVPVHPAGRIPDRGRRRVLLGRGGRTRRGRPAVPARPGRRHARVRPRAAQARAR